MSGSIGDNVFRASGVIAAAAAGISWQDVETGATFTAVAGNGYPVNTTAQACTVTLPASASVGDEIIFTDYARNWGTNALTIDQNSLNYQGVSDVNPIYDTTGESVHIVYMDATQGWIPINDGAVAEEVISTYMAATGPDGAEGVTSGDYKVHTFTATKTDSNAFAVSNAGLPAGSNTAEYIVVAGGGGGSGQAGGGGGGGYRSSVVGESTGGGGTIETAMGSFSIANYNVTIGDGGTAGGYNVVHGLSGTDSTFTGTSTITSAGGGGGALNEVAGYAGGSGGGGSWGKSGGAGTSNQGYAGGTGSSQSGAHGGGGGGGAASVGPDGTTSVGGDGGTGLDSAITGSSVNYAAGGGGCSNGSYAAGSAGGASATDGANGDDATAGSDDATANRGGGGGGAWGAYNAGTGGGGVGGSGVVIIRYKFQN